MEKLSKSKRPLLSVVVASQNARESVTECIRSIESQCSDGSVEITVVDNSSDGTTEILKGLGSVNLVVAERHKLIPELWGIGISASQGESIALTTCHFLPAANWIEEILKHQKQKYAGIGGAIENDPDAGLVSWAVYFCRYTSYMLPFDAVEVEDFAADNASYDRASLMKVEFTIKEGFWETFVHKEMSRQGMRLLKIPTAIVYHQRSFSFAGFIKQRLIHGRQYGGARSAGMNVLERVGMAAASPAIPALYMFRIIRSVAKKNRNILKLVLCSPILIFFLLSWSLGEFSGYLLGPNGKEVHS